MTNEELFLTPDKAADLVDAVQRTEAGIIEYLIGDTERGTENGFRVLFEDGGITTVTIDTRHWEFAYVRQNYVRSRHGLPPVEGTYNKWFD